MKQHDLTPTRVAPADLTPYPGNPTHGDLDAIRESIQVNGFYEPVIVQKSTGYVVSGNHRVLAARDLELETNPALFLYLTDTEARRILIASNATARKAVTDDIALGRSLALIADDDEVTGVGLAPEDVDDYLAIIRHVDREDARFAESTEETTVITTTQPPVQEQGKVTPGSTPREPEPRPAPEPQPAPETPRTNTGRRVYILDLPLDAHTWLTHRLTELTEEHGYQHHTQAVLETIGDATGHKAPHLTGPEYTDPQNDGVPTR